jgi:hypothetical protein
MFQTVISFHFYNARDCHSICISGLYGSRRSEQRLVVIWWDAYKEEFYILHLDDGSISNIVLDLVTFFRMHNVNNVA